MDNLKLRPIKVRTILFTEECPLDCLYCNLKKDPLFGTGTIIDKKEFLSIIDNFDKIDDYNTINTRLLFSGGEPFVKWSWIKEVIEKISRQIFLFF